MAALTACENTSDVQYGTVQIIGLTENHSGRSHFVTKIMMCIGCKAEIPIKQWNQRASLETGAQMHVLEHKYM